VRLTPAEEARLLVFTAAELARRRRDRGILLNGPEAVAIICDAMHEAARDGGAYEEIETAGRAAVKPAEVIPGVAALVDEVRVEVAMDDGTRLVVLLDPLGDGLSGEARPGAVLGAPPQPTASGDTRERRSIVVRNEGLRVVRVSSHFPFHTVNPSLLFDRTAAEGFRLDLPSGDSIRWGPGETREVTLVRFAGSMGGDSR
jgi:urease subunit gamma/beta